MLFVRMTTARHFNYGDLITLEIAGDVLIGSGGGSDAACRIVNSAKAEKDSSLAVFRVCAPNERTRRGMATSTTTHDFVRSTDSDSMESKQVDLEYEAAR
jgi:hypothetical protein